MRYRSLLTIAFDSSSRLSTKTHYFQYRGISFKLIQDNPRKWADHLLTIVESEEARILAFRAAAEFLSALAWENHSRVALWDAGYRSWPEPWSLKIARPCMFSFPKINFGGTITGYGISRLPHIENEAQRTALALFREARASNNDYLKFLFNWQVMEVVGGQPVGFINKTFRRNPAKLHIRDEDLSKLPLDGRTLGNYLLDDCRHAIAHLKRKPGQTELDVDDPVDRIRLAHSVRVVVAFAEYFIRENLKLNKTVFLWQLKRGAIPTYLESADARGRFISSGMGAD